MLKSITYCLVLFLSWDSLGSLAKHSSVCLLHDQPNQCGAFCLQALRPMIDHIAFHQKKLNESQTKLDRMEGQLSDLKNSLDQKEASCENAISHNLQTKLEAIERQLSAMQELLSKANKKSINTHPYNRIGSRLIYVENENYRNWEQAEAFCRGINGHLITIQNNSELSALDEKLERNTGYWLGITDVAKKGEFVSVASGKPAPFFDWAFPQPNAFGNVYDCVTLYSGKMFNLSCSKVLHFICEATFD
ncbi:accessory gland protein Acp29AB-like [Drosophila ficusphila]|uniref:accessory gland protein Acp29AB-like n=1 Tax=Drosophila ficusphila TaxID=30025 RepID=UPI001C8AF086|nr:accessory gland protein Acp29AB-like [Drosophila ficusphila]